MAVTITNQYDHPDRPPAKQERTKVVFANFHRSLQHYMDKGQRDRYKEFMKAYRAYSEVPDDGSVSNLSIPLIAAHIDSFYARLVGMRPEIDIQPREPGDVMRAKKQKLLVDWQWDLMQMLLHGPMLAKSGLIYGIGWGKCTWRKEIRRRVVRRAFEPPAEVLGISLGPFQSLLEGFTQSLGGTSLQEDDVVVWDNPWFENIPVDQVYPDPDGYDEDSCRYLIHRTRMTLDELEALVKGGEIQVNRAAMSRLKKALEGGSLLDDEVGVTVSQEAANIFGGTGDSALPEDPTKREFTLLEHWTDERVRWAVSGNPEIELIRDEPHAIGMKPFVRFTPEPLPNELAGTSLTERLYSIWLQMNAMTNARMDNIFRVTHPQIAVPRGSSTNPTHLRFKAGGWFFADPQNPPYIFEYPELKSASYREMSFLDQQANRIGGTPTFRGEQQEGDTTATEANLLAQASGTRFGAMLQQMTEQPFKRLGRLMVRYNELNVNEERAARVLGDEFMGVPTAFETISPQDLASRTGAELDITIDVAQKDPDTRIVKLRRATEAFQALAQAAQFDPALVPLARRAAAEMARFHDIPNPEVLLEQGQQMAQAQAQQQQLLGNFQGQQRTRSEGDQIAADVNNAPGLVS